MGLFAQSPARPRSPHVFTSLPPRLRVEEKIASICLSVSFSIGLSLFTYTARPSRATRTAVGLYLYFASNLSFSAPDISRDIGPSCAVPSVRAGGAVDEPLPSIWMLTFGYAFL